MPQEQIFQHHSQQCDSIPHGEEADTGDQQQAYRTVPAFACTALRRCKRGLTSQDKLLLSVLYYSTDEDNASRLTNQEIAVRMGGGIAAQAALWRLKRLERMGVVERFGNGRNRKVVIFRSPDYGEHDESKPLKIKPHIWNNQNLSPTKKIIIATILEFPDVQPKNWTWYAKRSGVNVQSWKLNLRQIILKFHPEPYKVLCGNPIRFYKQPYKVLCALFGTEGSDLGKTELAKANLKAAPLPVDNRPPHPMEDQMQLASHHKNNRLAKMSDITPKKAKEAFEINEAVIPDYIMSELQDVVFKHKHISSHKSKKKLLEAASVVAALRSSNGLSSIMSSGVFDKVVNHMSKSKFVTPDLVSRALRRRFNRDERLRLYEMLDNSMSEEYGGKGGKVELRGAAVPNDFQSGFSRLVWVWLCPPKKKQQPKPTIAQKYKPFVDSLQKEFPQDSPFKIAGIVKQLMEHHDKVRPGHEYSTFGVWLRDFAAFALGKNDFAHDDRTAGWLRPGSATFQDWEREWRDRMDQRDAARAARLSDEKWQEKLRRDEEVRAFYDEYGPDAVAEVYGREALENVRLT